MKNLLELVQSNQVEVSVSIVFNCVVDRNDYSLGTLRLKKDDRSLILDVSGSYANDNNNHTTIDCVLEYDAELIEGEDTKSDLMELDLHSLDLGTLYIGEEWSTKPESITLFLMTNGSTKAIELEID